MTYVMVLVIRLQYCDQGEALVVVVLSLQALFVQPRLAKIMPGNLKDQIVPHTRQRSESFYLYLFVTDESLTLCAIEGASPVVDFMMYT